ncbi:MAG: LytTR family DNA-binding domain-containing protein [Acidobacteriota bacterium]
MAGATITPVGGPGPRGRGVPPGAERWGGFLLALSACTALGLLFAGHLRFYHRVEWTLALWWGLKDAFLWGLLAPVIVVLSRRAPVSEIRWIPNLLVHGLAAIVLTGVHSTLAILVSAVTEGLRSETFWQAVQGLAVKKAALSLLIYGAVAGAAHAVLLHRRFQDGRGSEGYPRARGRAAPEPRISGPARRLLLRSRGRERFLDVARIDRIEAEGNYVRIHAGGETWLERRTLRSLEAQLDPSLFLRVHRSHLVNLDRVDRIEPRFQGGYAVVLRDGTSLRLSRTYRKRLAERIGRAF